MRTGCGHHVVALIDRFVFFLLEPGYDRGPYDIPAMRRIQKDLRKYCLLATSTVEQYFHNLAAWLPKKPSASLKDKYRGNITHNRIDPSERL